MIERLGELGYAIDATALLGDAARSGGRTLGRPHLADALVAAGHVVDRGEAFDRCSATGRPAFVPRSGATVGEVVGDRRGRRRGRLAGASRPDRGWTTRFRASSRPG